MCRDEERTGHYAQKLQRGTTLLRSGDISRLPQQLSRADPDESTDLSVFGRLLGGEFTCFVLLSFTSRQLSKSREAS